MPNSATTKKASDDRERERHAPMDSDGRRVGAEHHQLAMGEVDDVHHAEDDDQPQRRQQQEGTRWCRAGRARWRRRAIASMTVSRNMAPAPDGPPDGGRVAAQALPNILK